MADINLDFSDPRVQKAYDVVLRHYGVKDAERDGIDLENESETAGQKAKIAPADSDGNKRVSPEELMYYYIRNNDFTSLRSLLTAPAEDSAGASAKELNAAWSIYGSYYVFPDNGPGRVTMQLTGPRKWHLSGGVEGDPQPGVYTGFGVNNTDEYADPAKAKRLISAENCKYLVFEIQGERIPSFKVEINGQEVAASDLEVWFPSGQAGRVVLPLSPSLFPKGYLGKFQIVFKPGKLNCVVENPRVITDLSALQEKQKDQRVAVQLQRPDWLNLPSMVQNRGRYSSQLNQLVGFYFNRVGNRPPAALKAGEIQGKHYLAAYHVLEDDPTHLGISGATTSETQTAFFVFMVLYGIISGDRVPAESAYNFIRYYMMPHDGWESPQLPDSELNKQKDQPQSLVWLVNLATGGAIPENTCYKETEQHTCLVLSENGLPNFDGRWDASSPDTQKFVSASDADFWFINGLALGSENLGLDFKGQLERMVTTFEKALFDFKDGSAGVSMGIYWGGKTRFWGERGDFRPYSWLNEIDRAYTGYQSPAAWLKMGRPQIAQKTVKLLESAQAEYKKRYGLDLFMPVIDKTGKMGWEGPDPRTNWMGFQYRAFAQLAYYYYLTGDPQAKIILDKFLFTIKTTGWKVEGGKVLLAFSLDRESGGINEFSFDPNNYAVMAQGLIYLAKKTGEPAYRSLAEKLLDDLALRQAQEGNFPNSADSNTYGFQNFEVGSAFALYYLLLEKQ